MKRLTLWVDYEVMSFEDLMIGHRVRVASKDELDFILNQIKLMSM